MAGIDSLMRQHEEILALLEELAAHESDRDIMDNAKGLSLTVGQLARKVYFHLLSEERVVYPILFFHDDESVRETGRSYSLEMDAIVRRFKRYRGRYSNAGNIFDLPSAFRYSTVMVARDFTQRFEDERRGLFPIAERYRQDPQQPNTLSLFLRARRRDNP